MRTDLNFAFLFTVATKKKATWTMKLSQMR